MMKMIKRAAVLLLIFGMVSVIHAEEHPSKEDIIKEGYFGFPQRQASVLYNHPKLRLSVWNNDTLVYAQAVVWADNSKEIGRIRLPMRCGDTSAFCIDVDSNASITPNLDRCYCLDPWFDMNGLYYSIILGGRWGFPHGYFGTILKDDSLAKGSICYVELQGEQTVRIDNYVIPLSELGRQTGDTIRLCYWVNSVVPKFKMASVEYKRDRAPYSYSDVPFNRYHTFRLKKGEKLTVDAIAGTWAQETDVFTRSKQIVDSNEFWFKSRQIGILSVSKLKLSHSILAMIRKELEEEDFLKTIEIHLGLKPEDASRLRLEYNPEYEKFELSRNGVHPSIFEAVYRTIERYVYQRKVGHTKEYAYVSLRGNYDVVDSNDKYLQALLRQYPGTPVSWLKKAECKTFRYNDCVSYYLIDGGVAWVYEIVPKSRPKGGLFCMWERRDAKDYDVKYQQIIKEVEKQVGLQMKREGIRGLGSIHGFWHLKKEYPKKEGIDWQSPSELNPWKNYD